MTQSIAAQILFVNDGDYTNPHLAYDYDNVLEAMMQHNPECASLRGKCETAPGGDDYDALNRTNVFRRLAYLISCAPSEQQPMLRAALVGLLDDLVEFNINQA